MPVWIKALKMHGTLFIKASQNWGKALTTCKINKRKLKTMIVRHSLVHIFFLKHDRNYIISSNFIKLSNSDYSDYSFKSYKVTVYDT